MPNLSFARHRRILLSLPAALVLASASAQPADASRVLRGDAAMGDWTRDAPGVRRLITVTDLPKPYATSSARSFSRIVTRPANAVPKVPAGFQVDLLASGLTNPRKIITAPNGDLFVVESSAGRVKVLRPGSDGRIEETVVFAQGLRQPFGLSFYPPGPEPTHLYVGNTDSVVRFEYRNGDLKARGEPERIVSTIPGGGRLEGGGHWTRDIVFSKDGSKMFVSVGSLSNVSDDARERNRANVLEFNPDGSGFRIYAWGIRNPVGLAIEPTTGDLWASVNERDGLGDNLPPDYITRVQEGGFYGWPWYYIGNHQDPRHEGKRPDLADKVIVPDVLVQAHMASLCMTFYTGTQFPPEYRGGAFAAEHGSWNRHQRVGYKVIYVPIQDGKATGEYVDFMTGFIREDGQVWGRPVGVTVGKDGSLIVTEDGAGTVWRVRYTGSTQANATR
ncbi:MAG TPA: sorbosone dehydrogenase family protein [Verrucomicrobia bacterium]|nr:sorbosone dehydrogenase family protein [Verrucomicrobiota bacterium]